jgi:hypothetical protein
VDYNLTDRQKAVARYLVEKIREGVLPETFNAIAFRDGRIGIPELKAGMRVNLGSFQVVAVEASLGDLEALMTSAFASGPAGPESIDFGTITLPTKPIAYKNETRKMR